MPRLCFKREFFDAIRAGRKTTTIRRWGSRKIGAGDRVFSPGLGRLNISDCREIRLDQLQESDARADGFDSLDELHKILKRFYPDADRDGKSWYRIVFALEEAAPLPTRKRAGAPKRPRGKLKAKSQGKSRIKMRRGLGRSARIRLAEQVRAELDKAVRQSRSLSFI